MPKLLKHFCQVIPKLTVPLKALSGTCQVPHTGFFSLSPIRLWSSFGDHLFMEDPYLSSWLTHIFLHGSCSLAYTSRCLCSRICRSLLPQAKRESLSVTQVPTYLDINSGCFPGNSEISSLWSTQVPPTDGVRRSSVLAHPAPQLGSKPLLVSSCQISCSLSFKQSNVQHPKVGYQSNLPSEKSNDE